MTVKTAMSLAEQWDCRTHQAHHVPEHLQEGVQVEALGAAEGDAVRLPRDGVNLLHAAHVDLVEHVQALDVPPVALRMRRGANE